MMSIRYLFALFAFLILSLGVQSVVTAQQIVTDAEGKLIRLLPGGQWEYVEEQDKPAKQTKPKKEAKKKEQAKTPTPKKEKEKQPEQPKKKAQEPAPKANKDKNPYEVEAKPKKQAKQKTTKTPSNEAKTNTKSKSTPNKSSQPKANTPKQPKTKQEKTTATKTPKEAKPSAIEDKGGEDCVLDFKRVDEFSGKESRGLKERKFFSFTPSNLKETYKTEDFMLCSGFLYEVVGVRLLQLTFSFDSPVAAQKYGYLPQGSRLEVLLLNGKTVILFAEEGDDGQVLLGKTVYTAYYAFAPSDEKELLRSEVDKVRMNWSTGYQEYEVFELDFFIDQLRCLRSIK